MAQVDSPNKVQLPEVGTNAPDHVVVSKLELPDAPSAMTEIPAEGKPSDKHMVTRPSPVGASTGFGRTFLIANSVMIGSSITNAEAIARCPSDRCLSVPDSIRSRVTLYGIAIPASVAVGYLSYELKKSGNKWWYLPLAVVTGANVVYAAHAAQYTH